MSRGCIQHRLNINSTDKVLMKSFLLDPDRYKNFILSELEHSILLTIDDWPEITLYELEELFSEHAENISAVVSKLYAIGYVNRYKVKNPRRMNGETGRGIRQYVYGYVLVDLK